jgi:hypothetical protein
LVEAKVPELVEHAPVERAPLLADGAGAVVGVAYVSMKYAANDANDSSCRHDGDLGAYAQIRSRQ